MNELISGLEDVLIDDTCSAAIELVEFELGKSVNDEILQCFRMLGPLVGAGKVINSLNNLNLIRQTQKFILAFNSGTINKKKLNKYREKISNDRKKCEEELSRVLLILDKTIEVDKSFLLGIMFRGYIMEEITWQEFCEFSEIIRMMILSDIKILNGIYNGKIKDTVDLPIYPFNRLKSLGLVDTLPKGDYPIDPNGKYYRTDKFVTLSRIGGKFCNVLVKNKGKGMLENNN